MYNELEEDQTKQVAKEVTQAIRAIYQEGHKDKPTAEYLLSPPMVRTQETAVFLHLFCPMFSGSRGSMTAHAPSAVVVAKAPSSFNLV